jgi:hypothetical protein
LETPANEKTYETYWRGGEAMYTVSRNMVTGQWYLRDKNGKIISRGDLLKVQAAKDKYKENNL